jgi:hypothetical protein
MGAQCGSQQAAEQPSEAEEVACKQASHSIQKQASGTAPTLLTNTAANRSTKRQLSQKDQLQIDVDRQTEKVKNNLVHTKSDERCFEELFEQARQLERMSVLEEQAFKEREVRTALWEETLMETRQAMRCDSSRTPYPSEGRPANRFGSAGELPPFERGKYVPLLALINPHSGAMAGDDILHVSRRSPYYRDRFFNIIDVVKSANRRGGLLDVFRCELNAAKEEAKSMQTRPRLISGGGDGTGSFALFITFLALKANPDRVEDGLGDTGNGFIWTDAMLEEFFPAIVQMPLGSANDFGNILGWGQKHPGDATARPWMTPALALKELQTWMLAVVNPSAAVVNFDVFGIMPEPGRANVDFKLAELTGQRGGCPNENGDLLLRRAGLPVPFMICLYFSTGIGAYMVARFQINRHRTPLANRLEYLRQAAGIMFERTPPQLQPRCDGIEIDCEDEPYFPPRRHKTSLRGPGNKGSKYREVGFYNIGWQAHLFHGHDRASVRTRLNPWNDRKPATFDDGEIDMYRLKTLSALRAGVNLQTDKKKDMCLTFDGGSGKGMFFQWDGEARFAFSPQGDKFKIFIRKVLNIPVVLGPYGSQDLLGEIDRDRKAAFAFSGDTAEDKEAVRKRLLQQLRGDLDDELNASDQEISNAGFKVAWHS